MWVQKLLIYYQDPFYLFAQRLQHRPKNYHKIVNRIRHIFTSARLPHNVVKCNKVFLGHGVLEDRFNHIYKSFLFQFNLLHHNRVKIGTEIPQFLSRTASNLLCATAAIIA
jgi:hypothetical protein